MSGSAHDMSPEEFADVFRRVSERADMQSAHERSAFKTNLTEHFGEDPATYPVTADAIAAYDLPNLQPAWTPTSRATVASATWSASVGRWAMPESGR